LRRSTTIALALGLGIAIGIGGVPLAAPSVPTTPYLLGLTVGGEPIPADRATRPWLYARDDAFRAETVVLRHGEHRWEVTRGELGASIDVEATLARARALGHDGTVIRRMREARAARRGQLDVPLVYRLDHEIAAGVVARYAADLAVPAVDARLDLDAHSRIPDVPGQELDVAASVNSIAESYTRAAELDVVTRAVDADVTTVDLEDVDVSKVLSRFETKFAVWKTGRSQNVALAASFINGVMLRPGLTFSFNDRVGPRTRERGFQEAPEIMGDELTVGIGGGTCQVSSTLHAASLHGGLEIVERKSHTRPSDYTFLGLDATVAFPKVDLKIRNPYAFPVVVHSFVPEPGTLRIELLGGEAVSKVEYKYGVSRIEPFLRRITVKSWLQPGRGFRKQKGTRGMDVISVLTIQFLDGRVEKRQYYSGYKATPEVFWVAPDYDEATLPPLPEHARGIEGRLEEDGSDVYPTTG
jgi:vancomycin resistance protein YoaR